MPKLPRRLAPGEEASLVDHLGELRGRLVISLGAVALCTALMFFLFRDELIELLNAPLPDGKQPTTLSVAEPFFTSLKVSIYAGFAIALPIVLYQAWSFLAPALEAKTQRVIAFFVAIATVLFGLGLAAGYYFVLPKAVEFLTNFDDELYDIQIRAKDYYSFAAFSIIAVGLVAEMPIFMLALARLRVLPGDKLRRNRRVGYVAMAVLAMILPGSDPVTMLMLMFPLMGLFEATIWLIVVCERRWERAALEDELAASEL